MLDHPESFPRFLPPSDRGRVAIFIDGASLFYAALQLGIEIVSLRSMTSDSLINVADTYIDLETIQHKIEKTSAKPSNSRYVYQPLSVATP